MKSLNILPPTGCDPKDIKHEIKMLENGYVDISIYPNGVEMVVTYVNGKADITTSKPLVRIDDNTYRIPD